MGNALEFILSLKDMLTPGMTQAARISQTASNNIAAEFDKIGRNGTKMNASLGELNKRLDAVNKIRMNTTIKEQFDAATRSADKLKSEIEKLENAKPASGGGGIGVGAIMLGNLASEAVMKIGGMIKGAVDAGIEKAEAFHQAEAQLKNTMQNTGTFTQERFEGAIAGAQKLAKSVNYSSAEIMDLQSHLRMVGGMTEEQMGKMTQASLDLAAKFKIGATEAGEMIAKSINNPEMLRRLAQSVKIDPSVQAHLQKLAKDGKAAQAQMELLTVVEKQVGGAAKAAFDANPLAQYHKAVSDMEKKMGDAAIAVQSRMAPSMVEFAGVMSNVVDKTLSAIGATETHTQQLMTEQAQINGTVGLITSLNQGNAERIRLLKELSAKYPDIFKNINTETTTNSELLKILKDVNSEYRQRIELAGQQGIVDDATKKLQQAISQGDRAHLQLYYLKMYKQTGDKSYLDALKKNATEGDAFEFANTLKGLFNPYGTGAMTDAYTKISKDANIKQDAAQKKLDEHNKILTVDKYVAAVNDATKLLGDKSLQKNYSTKTLQQIRSVIKNANAGNLGDVTSKLNALMSPEVTAPAQRGYADDDDKKGRADGINSGGQRVVTINIGKQIENVVIHVMGDKEAGQEIEDQIREALRRVAYSMNGVVS